MATKLVCFVDETGQDTLGKLFLVAVVIKEREKIASLEKKLIEVEKRTNKGKKKWQGLPFKIKKAYLTALADFPELAESIFYSVYENTKAYLPLIALTIAKATLAKRKGSYKVSVVIDGLTAKGKVAVRFELKRLRIHYDKIRGLKDSQNSLLRVADSAAGFLRDYEEGQGYARLLMKKFQRRKIFIKI